MVPSHLTEEEEHGYTGTAVDCAADGSGVRAKIPRLLDG